MSIFEIKPGIYKLSAPEQKPWIAYLVYDNRNIHNDAVIIEDKADLKPYHTLVICGKTIKERIDFVMEYLTYDPPSYSNILR